MCDEIRFHKIAGQMCRILPYDKELFKNSENGANLFVKGLPPAMTHKELYELFTEFGYVISCRVSLTENSMSRCYGFVLYKKASDANKAIIHVSINLTYHYLAQWKVKA